jgi:prepilin-type N-terminal cleavage/methylation domain-containing protein
MITTTLPRHRKSAGKQQGFTLVEVMICASIGSFVLLGVLTMFLFLGRSSVNLGNYSDMEAQSRKALELFAEDTRQASSVVWASATSITLAVNSVPVTYEFVSGTFRRTKNSVTTNLVTGITSFTFLAYTINGTAITNFADATARTVADHTTKQIQISLSAARNSRTVATSTNIVLSARYVLRNKTVTA